MGEEMTEYNWLEEDQYKKLLFHLRTKIDVILRHHFKFYGQDIYIPVVVNYIMFVIEQAFKVVRGKDRPIVLPKELEKEIYSADD